MRPSAHLSADLEQVDAPCCLQFSGCPYFPPVTFVCLTCLIKPLFFFLHIIYKYVLAYNPVWREYPLLSSKCAGEGWSQVLKIAVWANRESWNYQRGDGLEMPVWTHIILMKIHWWRYKNLFLTRPRGNNTPAETTTPNVQVLVSKITFLPPTEKPKTKKTGLPEKPMFHKEARPTEETSTFNSHWGPTENLYHHYYIIPHEKFTFFITLKKHSTRAPGWLSLLSVCLCSGHDPRVMRLNPTWYSLSSGEVASPSPSAPPPTCALTPCLKYKKKHFWRSVKKMALLEFAVDQQTKRKKATCV